MPYRKLTDSNVWHWMPNCRWWPSAAQVEAGSAQQRATKPTGGSGELCNECRAKAKRAG